VCDSALSLHLPVQYENNDRFYEENSALNNQKQSTNLGGYAVSRRSFSVNAWFLYQTSTSGTLKDNFFCEYPPPPPFQHHSTNAPYSFIHLPPTLYNIFLSILQFPLLVSFRQRSILIHTSTTDVV